MTTTYPLTRAMSSREPSQNSVDMCVGEAEVIANLLLCQMQVACSTDVAGEGAGGERGSAAKLARPNEGSGDGSGSARET